MSRKALITGGVFGLIAPFLGLFVGLQVSVIVGNILAFPLIALSYVVGEPFGNWLMSPLMIVALVLSVVMWALIFGIVGKALQRR